MQKASVGCLGFDGMPESMAVVENGAQTSGFTFVLRYHLSFEFAGASDDGLNSHGASSQNGVDILL